MNTPAHVAASVLIWRGERGWGPATAITFGALLPDLPMFGFYAYQKLIAGRTEHDIWSTLYFDKSWQLIFDLFNSIPLAILIAAVCYGCGFRWGMLFALSAFIHMLCDLPVHHDDAHRHFLPLSTWRFESPLSYWDPNHHGGVFMWLELLFAIGSSTFVIRTAESPPIRYIAAATLFLYFAGLSFAAIMWLPLGLLTLNKSDHE